MTLENCCSELSMTPGVFASYANVAAMVAGVVPGRLVGKLVYVQGYYSADDGGQGAFRCVNVNPGAADGGHIIASATAGFWFVRQIDASISPEMWGAVGDGATDCYFTLKSFIAFVNTGACRHVEFGFGKTYFINQYILAGNGITALRFASVSGLTVDGNGSLVQSRGGFNRAATSTGTVAILAFDLCNNLIVRNISYNGGSQTITHDGGVAESPNGYGVQINSCIDVLLENVNASYCITDGFLVNASSLVNNPQIACRGVTLTNCSSTYNARQGISVIQVYGLVCSNCDFNYTGKGAYGVHAPGLGIDVEPDYTTATAHPLQMDFDTQNILFVNCRVQHNIGGMFSLASTAGYVQQITFLRCAMVMDSADSDKSIGGADCGQASFLFNYFDVGLGYLVNGGTAFVSQSARWEGNYFTGKGSVMLAIGTNMPVTIENNRFISTATAPFTQAFQAIVWNTDSFFLRFIGNYVFVPGAAWAASSGAYDARGIMQLWFVNLSEGNIYATDLVAAVGPHGSANFFVDYSGAKRIQDESFLGVNRGTADTFQPGLNYAFNTNYPYSLGYTNIGDTLIFGPSDQAFRTKMGNAAPVAGAWLLGDKIINDSPSELGAGGSKYILDGWRCAVSGTPGTWYELRCLTGN